jgi:hypothetical protein
MWLSSRGAVVLVLLMVAIAAGGAQAAAGAERRAAPAEGRAQTTTVVHTSAGDDRSAPLTVLLVGVGAVVGVVVGLVPALVVAMFLGYVPPPRLRPRLAGMLVEPPRAPPVTFPDTLSELPPAPVTVRAAEPAGGDEPPSSPIAILAHARHQSVYDSAYTEQLERVEKLRAAIGGRLRKPPAPPSD